MKIFNKIVQTKEEPQNKNDIWFDGSYFKVYKHGEWKPVTISQETAEIVEEMVFGESGIIKKLEQLDYISPIFTKNTLSEIESVIRNITTIDSSIEYSCIEELLFKLEHIFLDIVDTTDLGNPNEDNLVRTFKLYNIVQEITVEIKDEESDVINLLIKQLEETNNKLTLLENKINETI